MRRFLFGFDEKQPEACARELKARGIDAVVVGAVEARTEEALERHGLELYLCFGAHGLGADFSDEAHLARDAEGRPARWFSSGCPNDAALSQARLDAALERMRQATSARGLFVDGARFASFASQEGSEAFFTCFCPRCTRRMEEMGLDASRVREAVARLAKARRPMDADAEALRGWFAFRAACVRDEFARFAAAVHVLPGTPLAGAFVFAPSLGGFVGQDCRSWRELDVVSPMLYRAYPHVEGPACLGHEWAAALELFGAQGMRALPECVDGAAQFAKAVSPVPDASPEALRREGFLSDRIGAETSAARRGICDGQRLLPILQIEDASLEASAREALDAGADGVGYFMYGQADLASIPQI